MNGGLSGGEKKRNGISRMVMLEPMPSILGETNSDSSVDALCIVAKGVNKLKRPDTNTIVIIRYDRLLDSIKSDITHALFDGYIVRTEGPGLAREIENKGYDWIKTGAE